MEIASDMVYNITGLTANEYKTIFQCVNSKAKDAGCTAKFRLMAESISLKMSKEL